MNARTQTDLYRDRATRESFQSVPVIDLSALWGHDTDAMASLADRVRLACAQAGFFYIKNHDIPMELMDRAYARSREFFNLPAAEKLRHHISNSLAHRGFIPPYEESFYTTLESSGANKDHKECFQLGIDLPRDDPAFAPGVPLLGPNLWPDLPGFKDDLGAYFNALRHLSDNLFRAFALALFLPEDFFHPLLRRPPSVLRLAHYFENNFAADETNWGISAHTDYEVFTILQTDQPGLQALNAANEWVDIPPINGTFIINIGDMLELLSNGAFIATSHRVTNLGKERYSFPMFCTVDYETVVGPLPQWVTDRYPAAYQSMRSGAHLFSSIIRAHGYLREKWERGELSMPADAAIDTYFGRSKKDGR